VSVGVCEYFFGGLETLIRERRILLPVELIANREVRS
jgi:hypothetical protein